MLGIGVDVVDVPAFREQLADPASRFVARTFTVGERRAAEGSADPARHFAVRFAAKEALIKAWSGALYGQPPAMAHADFMEIEVVQDPWRRPALRLHGEVATALDALGPTRTHLSLSHDGPTAVAFVTLHSRAEEGLS